MRNYQFVGVFKSTSLKAINRRKNSGITAKDLERGLICGELNEPPFPFPQFTEEEILEIEKQLDDAFRKAFHIVDCNRTFDIGEFRSVIDE